MRLHPMSYYTLSNLTDALPAALFGIFALWAASSTRHWFVRTAVVGAALLTLLLIPAYEVVIEFGTVVLILIASLTIWRKRRQRAERGDTGRQPLPDRVPRLSLATLLLLIVVVAVVTSVGARVPTLSLPQWAFVFGLGLMGGCVGVACVWIVCGRTALWIRVLALPLVLIVFTVIAPLAGQIPAFLTNWTKGAYYPFQHYWDDLLKSAWWITTYWVKSIGIGMATMILWLVVIRRAGWFDPLRERPRVTESNSVDRGTRIARSAAVALFILIALFPLAILYRLLLPPAIPTFSLPQPNGWDDLMAAGETVGPDLQRALTQWMQTKAALPANLYRPDVVALVRRGLDREVVNPNMYIGWSDDVVHKFRQLNSAVNAYAIAASRTSDLPRQLDAYWDLLRLTNEGGRVVGYLGRAYTGAEQWESTTLRYYWPIRSRLSQTQCVELAARLIDYDKHRDTWADKCARQRLVDANANWEMRLYLVLCDWSGRDPYWNGSSVYTPVVQLRLLIADLGVRAFQMRHGKLPDTLDELVPEFLQSVPSDPYRTGPIIYRRTKDGYKIYSVGQDGVDDDGRAPTGSSVEGDYTSDLMFQ
jgi:hypothetical protein